MANLLSNFGVGTFVLCLFLIAWPIYEYLCEYSIFKRKMVTAALLDDGSSARKFLNRGTLNAVILTITSAFFARILLTFSSRLQLWHWLVLSLAPIFIALVTPFSEKIAKLINIKKSEIQWIGRRGTYFLSISVLVILMLLIDYFLIIFPNVRGLDFERVIIESFNSTLDKTKWKILGYILAAYDAINAAAWYFAQNIIPQIAFIDVKYLAWTVFIVINSMAVFIFTQYLLGVNIIFEKLLIKFSDNKQAVNIIPISFILVFLLLAIPYFYLTHRLTNLPPLETGDIPESFNLCKLGEHEVETIESSLMDEMNLISQEAKNNSEIKINEEVDLLFQSVENNVDDYLDWHYSLIGNYSALGTSISAKNVSEAMGKMLEDKLFKQTNFQKKLESMNVRINEETKEYLPNKITKLQGKLNQNIGTCSIKDAGLDHIYINLEGDKVRAQVSAASGLTVSAVFASKVASTLVTKMVATKGFASMASSVSKLAAGKWVSSLGAGALFAPYCAPTGLFAIACGAAAAVTTWFAVDAAAITIDERWNREEMKRDMMQEINKQKMKTKTDLIQINHRFIDRVIFNTSKGFNPSRDG